MTGVQTCALPIYNFKRKKKPCGHLAGIIQRKDEPLKDYVHRFNTAVQASERHQLSTRVQFLYANTTSVSLARELVEHPPQTEYELANLTDRLSDAEEIVRTIPIRAPRTEQTNQERQKKEVIPERGQRRQSVRSPLRRPYHYTHLRRPRGEILAALEGRNLLNWPKRHRETKMTRE